METLNTVDQALDWRYAVKKFDPDKKIPAEQMQILERALVKSPSSYGLQPWRFLVIKSPKLREKLKVVSWNQSQVNEASEFVVFLTKERVTEKDVDHYIQQIASVRSVATDSLKGFRDVMVTNVVQGMTESAVLEWSRRQSYIAMGFLLHSAALLKIDATPMEGLSPVAYDEILQLNGSGWKTVAAVALGYRHSDDQFQFLKKVRFDQQETVQYL